MKLFMSKIKNDLLDYRWWELFILLAFIFFTYGALVVEPTVVYDFAAAKGDGFQVFLTYFFMRRWTQGIFSALFHDFSPFWNASIGLMFFFVSILLLGIVLSRAKIGRGGRLFFLLLWIGTPFFYNRSVYQHALPCETIAFCFDALILLLFQELRKKWTWKTASASFLFVAMSIGIYQSHANLLLTALLGLCALTPRPMMRDVGEDLCKLATILGLGILIWGMICYGPVILCDLVGFHIPPSGGAHDEIYWFAEGYTFTENFMGLLCGLLLNWGYNAFFVVGLRFVLLAFFGAIILACCTLCRKSWSRAALLMMFSLSILAFPILQCASANIRTYYCFIPLIAFSGLYLWQASQGKPYKQWITGICLGFSILALGHETATLYYFRARVREQDQFHMGIIAHDLWQQYGTTIPMPVAIVGGFTSYSAGWEAMRPFRFLPLINDPFSLYSGVTSNNVPREFYMISRELVGITVQLPEWDHYQKLRTRKDLVTLHPAYPIQGYIFEAEGVIVVNLGAIGTQWPRFSFNDFRSPNEILLYKSLKLNSLAEKIIFLTEPIRNLAKRYPWALTR